MTLATVGSLTISCRVVLMRSFDAQGFTFYSNHNSRKAMDADVIRARRSTFSGHKWNVRCASRARWNC